MHLCTVLYCISVFQLVADTGDSCFACLAGNDYVICSSVTTANYNLYMKCCDYTT